MSDRNDMLQDGLGSVRAEIAQNVAVKGSQSYAPYGEVFGASGTMSSPFAFTGEPLDGNGLQYHRARYMNPALGGFLSLDPFEGVHSRPMSLNGYSWVEGNVVNAIDPTGLLFWQYPGARAKPPFSGKGADIYDSSSYDMREKAYSGAWVAKFMEIVNGFGATHLEYSVDGIGGREEIDAIVFGSNTIDPTALNLENPSFNVTGTGLVYEIGPLFDTAGYISKDLPKEWVEVQRAITKLNANKPTLRGVFPADKWPVLAYSFPQRAEVAGMPYDWSNATWRAGDTLYATGTIQSIIPGFPRLGIFAPFVGEIGANTSQVASPTIYYIYLIADGLIIYATEREIKKNFGVVGAALGLADLLDKVFGRMEDAYNKLRGDIGRLPPVAQPVPRFAFSNAPSSTAWEICSGFNSGLCAVGGTVVGTLTLWKILNGFLVPVPLPNHTQPQYGT